MQLVKTTYIAPAAAKTAEEYLKEALAAELAAARTKTGEGIAGYESEIPEINKAYDALAANAYRELLAGQRASANALAGAGLYNSGYADSYKLAERLAYKNELNENEAARAAAIADIGERIESLKREGEKSESEIGARYARLLAEQADRDRESAIENAYSAAELGDFSGLEALGIDTSAAKRLYDAKLYSALNTAAGASSGKTSASSAGTKASESLGALESELAVGMAKGFVDNYSAKQGIPFSEILPLLERSKDFLTGKYGAAFYEKYLDTVLRSYPGSSRYTGGSLSSVEGIIAFINNKNNMHRFYKDGGYNLENIAALIANASLSDAEKKELYNYYAVPDNVIARAKR